MLRDLTEKAALEILKDQRVLSCYIRNCTLGKGIHCRAGDPSPWKLCPRLPAAETEGATWEPCLDCGWSPKTQHGHPRVPNWLYTWVILAGTCCSSELKRLEFKSSETPSHPVGVSTLCLPHLFLRISRERGGALGWWHIPWCPAGSSRTQCHIPPVQPPAWPRSQGVPQRP